MTKPKRYKRYSAEFKREAILRAAEDGVAPVSRNCLVIRLGDQMSCLTYIYRLIRKDRSGGIHRGTPAVSTGVGFGQDRFPSSHALVCNHSIEFIYRADVRPRLLTSRDQ